MKRMKCYIYTRVSTSMQVDGYSLDAQKDKLRKYAEFQNMLVAGEYCDEGKSGKNIEGRPEFLRMLRDIESGKDGVSFVLVFKLSCFGRNAADVLTSLQRMQDFGVNLICVEDGIDSSKDSGKLMISVLSAVAETSARISLSRRWRAAGRRPARASGTAALRPMAKKPRGGGRRGIEGGRDKAAEQGMRLVGAALEFGVELRADEPGVALRFDDLDERAVGRETGEAHAGVREVVAEVVVDS